MKSLLPYIFSLRLICIAKSTMKRIFFNIAIHFFLLTMSVVHASSDRYSFIHHSVYPMMQFRSYTQYAEDLRELDTGTEIEVSISPLSSAFLDKRKDERRTLSKEQSEEKNIQIISNIASRTGSPLGSNLDSSTFVPIAKGVAAHSAGSEIQKWLNQFGTSRVRLNADENLSLKSSQVDLLISVYEKANGVIFSQGSIHRSDERGQSNLGIGYRKFKDSYMLGGNTFFDYDFSRNHSRMGMGMEFWTDYLKLGANSYHRLTSWKNSPDIVNYEERPANGWDIRAQAWLPKLPSLGGKFTYEQYYGKEVALFGKSNRQHDPYVITAGINYTPVPLLTFNIEQRQGKSGENDTRVGVDFRYQLGAPLYWHVDPNEVPALRSLPGSRYDLVERNNNIVLEYRKKEIVQQPDVIEDIKIIGILTAGHTVHDTNVGFPSIGFKGAKFSLLLNGKASNFNWTSNASSWITVNNDGEVTFTGTGTKDRVTITAKPKDGNGSTITYSFALKSWLSDAGTLNWSDAKTYCTQKNSSLPTIKQINGDASYLSEWGDIFKYPGAVTNGIVWTSDQFDSDNHYAVSMADGLVAGYYDKLFNLGTICLRSF